jgi:hypothetical protein
MDFLHNKSDSELLKSLLAEAAKATNEVKCAQGDLVKAQGRLQFTLAVLNTLINRKED